MPNHIYTLLAVKFNFINAKTEYLLIRLLGLVIQSIFITIFKQV